MEFNRQEFGAAVAELLPEGHLNELGPGRPNPAAREALEQLSIEKLFAGRRIVDGAMARCCLAGLWLYHDYLERSHELSQEIETASGSYWHGLMHRREPDAGNAKYWFRRVGKHPVFATLASDARGLAEGVPQLDREAGWLISAADWDPSAFIDLCESARLGQTAAKALCQAIQEREWQLLFTFCFRSALE